MLDGTAVHSPAPRNLWARHSNSLRIIRRERERALSLCHVPGVCRYIDLPNVGGKLYPLTLFFY